MRYAGDQEVRWRPEQARAYGKAYSRSIVSNYRRRFTYVTALRANVTVHRDISRQLSVKERSSDIGGGHV